MEVDVTEKAKNLIRFGLIGLIALAALAGGGLYWYQHKHNVLTVDNAVVRGTDVALTAKTKGKVIEVCVSDGDYVEAGTVIARIEPQITAEDIQGLEQNVALAKQSYEQLQKGTTVAQAPAAVVDSGAQQRAADAYSRMQRMNELFAMGAISAAKRDEAAANYAAAQAAAQSARAPQIQTRVVPTSPEVLKQAELQVKQAEAALANAKADQGATDIIAEAAGVISLADGLAAGSEVALNQDIASLQKSSDAWLEGQLTATQAGMLHLGDFVTYELDGHKLQGSIQDIAAPEEENSGEMTIVKVSLPAEPGFIVKSGMTTALQFAIKG